MYKCIICKNITQSVKSSLNTCVAPMSDKLVTFKLQVCFFCGLLQKKIDIKWHQDMSNVYEKKYIFLGKHISIIDDKKVVDRNDLITTFLKKNLKLDKIKFGNFLDVGCGAGYFLKSFKKSFSKWNVYAHDVSSLNKELVTQYKIKEFFEGDLLKIKTRFDLISLNHVVEHLTDPTKIFGQLRLLLKSDGLLVLRLPNVKIVHTDLTMLDHCAHYTPESLMNLIRITGFKVHKIFNQVNPIELFFVVKKSNKKKQTLKKISKKDIFKTFKNLLWPVKILQKINANKKKIGLFGVGTSSFYIYSQVKKKIDFFVDEDNSKIGEKYYGREILSLKNVPNKSQVYIALHNNKLANKIKSRLLRKYKKIVFVVP